MRLEVTTPAESVFDGDVEQVIVPLPDGWLGILPGHLPFEGRILAGVLLFDSNGRRRKIATRGGTILVARDTVTLLTGTALLDSDLEAMEQQLGEEAAEIAEMESEAERHFSRVYRQLARSFKRRARIG